MLVVCHALCDANLACSASWRALTVVGSAIFGIFKPVHKTASMQTLGGCVNYSSTWLLLNTPRTPRIMRRFASWAVVYVLVCGVLWVRSQYTATYVPGNATLPETSEEGQAGTNRCGEGSNNLSMCQNLYLNSATDFCLWGPQGPEPVGIGNSEREVVSYCTKAGRGTRLIPPGTLRSVHFVRTPHYVQVSGTGLFENIHISKVGGGGELDPHGEDGLGNPIGGLVFTNAFGKLAQAHEWTSFIDENHFCLRVCKDGDMAADYCKHIYDEMGCEFNMPTAPDQLGVFESCEGPDADIVGVYTNDGVVSTFYQDQTKHGQKLPPPKSPQSLSKCSAFPSGLLQGSVKHPYAKAAAMTGASRQSMKSESVSTTSSSSATSSMLTSTSSSADSSSQELYPPISSNFSNVSSSPSSISSSSPSATSSSVSETTSTLPSESKSEEASPFGSVDDDAGVAIHLTTSIPTFTVLLLSLLVSIL